MSSRTVEVPASVTVRSISDFRTILADVMDDQEDVVLDLAGLTDADLSFVQITEAARRHLADRGRELRLLQPAQGPLAALLDRPGFQTVHEPAVIARWYRGDLQR